MSDDKDLYSILGVSRDASAEAIKKAYRKLARKLHPDLNPGDRRAEERFKEVSHAYDILGDPEKRKLYDEFGMAGVQGGFDAEQARRQRESARTQFRGFAGSAEDLGGFTSFEDIFGDLFGRPSGAGPRPAAENLESEIEIGLLDAVRGMSTTLELERPEICAACKGLGIDTTSGVSCPTCGGQGRARVGKGPLTFTRTCPQCNGAGRVSVRPCGRCAGAGRVSKRERLQVHIPAGVDTGSRIRLAQKGAAGAPGEAAGDLYLRVKVRPHPLLERRGDDLYMDVPITVTEALEGGEIVVPTAEGSLRVRVPPGSQSGRQLRVKNHGVPHLKGGGRGDLYLRLMVQVPQATPETRAAAKALEAGYGKNPRADLKL